MQVIRLARGGRKKYPVYRIVSADKARAVSGKFISVLGTYNPHTKELVIKKEELSEAISHGAQPSNAVLKLMQIDGIELPKWAKIKTRSRKPKKAEEASTEADNSNQTEAPTNEADVSEEASSETSAEDTPTEEAPKETAAEPVETANSDTAS